MNWKFEEGRIYWEENGELMAEATYHELENGEVDIDHTYVNPVLRGQGVAGKMMEVVANFLQSKNLKAIASCSYAQMWFEKNQEQYGDVISDRLKDMTAACRIDGKH